MNETQTSRVAAAIRRSGPRLGERLAAWRDAHLYSLVSSFGRLAQRPWAGALTIAVMAIALALPLGLALSLSGLQHVIDSLHQSRELSLFLKPELTPDAVAATAEKVRQQPGVATLALRTPEQGLAEFRELAEFAGALAMLDRNPLPTVLVIGPAPGAEPAALAATLGALPEADFVQHDAIWRERLGAWLALGRRALWVIAALLGIGALLVVGNTVRLDIQSRGEEIAIVQLLGATNGFVRRPFLYLGAWYGLGAGLLALILVTVAALALAGPLTALGESYGATALLIRPDPRTALMTLMLAGLLGWLGAWLAAGQQLRAARASLA